MDGDVIRQTFLEYFQGKGHTVIPSSSLVPTGDPTLLFTSAGMVPFKPYFMGEVSPPSRRLTSCQKSFRTSDVDEVGDHQHLTFFEMLGNFSIGDYFKNDAIAWAWEFVTEYLKLPLERLCITIYLDDDEAFRHWTDDVGVPPERIYRYGDKDNWWGPAGKEGPCGPSSEIHYDWGVEHGCGTQDCHPNHYCERFVELWNLVFMQFYQDPEGNRTPLPAPSIDTGLGLERAAAILQGVRSIYETDLLGPIVQRVSDLSGKEYGRDHATDYAVRVVAEHGRAVAFLMSDGVVPGNEGRGYVLRRVIRRAIRYGRQIGLEKAFLTKVVEAAIQRFKGAYPELSANHGHVIRVVGVEEERFAGTFERGIAIINEMFTYREDSARKLSSATKVPGAGLGLDILQEHDIKPEGSGEVLAHQALLSFLLPAKSLDQAVKVWLPNISGRETFVLYDTYGFPPELTAEIARERGLTVDMESFQQEMDTQRERARAAQAFSGAMAILPTYQAFEMADVDFVGYERLTQESIVAGILVGGASVGQAVKGQRVEVVLKETPFYAESGGQVGDTGVIIGPNGRIQVEDTQSPIAGIIVHVGTVEEGIVSLGEPVDAQVDPLRRQDVARNHSGTHILHAALRQVLGSHVRQAGSLVSHDRLRFDYSHVSPPSNEELHEIQSLANRKVRDDLAVTTRNSTYVQAVQEGALAFFGDKYGEVVRIVEMSDEERFSIELCGGTHVSATGQVGPLFVVGESGIGSGMRRVEAVTGRAAEGLFVEQSSMLESLSTKLETPIGDLEERLDAFMQDFDVLRKRLDALEWDRLKMEAEELLGFIQDVDGTKVLSARTSASSVDAMRDMGDLLKARMSSGVIVLGAVHEGRPCIVAIVTPDLVARGLHAGNIAKEAAVVTEGGGGGRPEMAQAGGKRADKLEDALLMISDVVQREIKP